MHLRRNERGSVLVIMAVAVPTLMVIMALAIDMGNWFVHKRQLQNRVDAAVLAAGVSYGTLFKNCSNNAITDVARSFAGVGGGSTYNASVNDPAKLTVKVNATDINAPDGSAGAPCAAHSGDNSYWTNVAAREANVTSFFAGFGVPVPTISASARVQVMRASTASGMRPFALVDPLASTCVFATFGFNPANEEQLTRVGTTTQWTGTAPNSMPQFDIPVSVRVGCGSNSHSYQSMAYVTRVGGPTQLDDLRLQPAGGTPCPNAYFLPRNGFVSCTARVTATVPLANPDNPGVRVRIGGNTINLNQAGNDWSAIITLTRRTGGANGELPIEVELRNGPGNPPWNQVGKAVVQAGKAADQGPITNVVLPDYARTSGSSLGNPSITVTLRDLRTSGIEVIDGGVDCEPGGGPNHNSNIAQMLQNGCPGPFAVKADAAACAMNAPPYTCVRGIDDGRLSSLDDDYDDLWAPNNCQGNKDENNWPNISAGDPRLIALFLTDAVPPVQSANDDYPITGFGGFYVTGWDGDPGGCGNDAPPDDAGPGSVWGRYVKLVLPSANGGPSTTLCNPIDTTACIAVLVR